MLVICSMAFLLEQCPDGFVPDGYVPPENVGQRSELSACKDWKGMLKDPVFYIMIGRVKTLMIVFLLSMIGQGLLYVTGEGQFLLFMAAITVIGLCFGALMGVYPAFTAEQLGTKNNSVNYGVMFTGFALAGLLGPTGVGKVFAETGSYHIAYLIAILLAATGFILIVIYQKVRGCR